MASGGVFSATELKALKAKHRATLKKHALRHLRTSPELHRMILADLKKRHPKVRKALRAKLRSTYKRLKSK